MRTIRAFITCSLALLALVRVASRIRARSRIPLLMVLR